MRASHELAVVSAVCMVCTVCLGPSARAGKPGEAKVTLTPEDGAAAQKVVLTLLGRPDALAPERVLEGTRGAKAGQSSLADVAGIPTELRTPLETLLGGRSRVRVARSDEIQKTPLGWVQWALVDLVKGKHVVRVQAHQHPGGSGPTVEAFARRSGRAGSGWRAVKMPRGAEGGGR